MLVLISSTGRVEQRLLEVSEVDEEEIGRLRALLNEAVVGQPTGEAVRTLSLLLADAEQAEALQSPAARTIAATTTARLTSATLLEMLGSDRSSRVVVGGVQNLTRFSDEFDSVKPVLEALEEQVVLLKLLGEVSDPDVVTVRIGQENPYQQLQTTSVVGTGYGSHADAWATMGIVGPTRMDYPSTMASVRAVARYVSRFLSQG
jgi:heat-inducible transcriptional repressor